jgi:magnesium transporter
MAAADTGSPRRQRRRTPPGTAPGTLAADPAAEHSQLSLLSYGPSGLDERDSIAVADIGPARAGHACTWVNMDGLRDVAMVEALGATFGLHGLALEDVVNTHQRPKAEDYDGFLFVVLRMPAVSEHIATEQMSIFLGRDFVATFQERPGDWFGRVRSRLHDPASRLRAHGADYLMYALIDASIDAYFPILESMGERVERLEQEVLEAPNNEHARHIHRLRRDLLTVRRAVWPMRELLNGLLRDEHPAIQPETKVFLRDCYDHTVQLMDMIDTQRDMIGSLTDIHLSMVNTRMNEIMKVLTIIATIFIPLGFIASLYGMNFDPATSPWNMPELAWRFGYPFALLLMLALAGALVFWFWHRGWIGGERALRRRAGARRRR